MIIINLTIDKRRCKNDGTYPLVFKLSCNGISRDVATGFSSKEADWNSRTGNIKETHPNYKVIAPRIKELELGYLSKLIQYEKTFPNSFDVQRIKEYLISSPKKSVTVYSFWEVELEQLYKSNRVGGAQVYKEALIAINKVKSLNVPFEEVDFNFLVHVEVEFKSKGVKQNTIGIHFRALRAIYNKAINSKIISYEFYPFRAYRIKKEATTPRVIMLEELRKYFFLNIEQSSWLYDSWLLGKLMFMLIGINFKDLIMLTDANLKGNRVHYSRAKTKRLYSIKLLSEAQEILNYFKGTDDNTLFGKLSKLDLQSKDKFTLIIRQKNKNFNKHLEKLGKMIECKEKLTGYVFRYTWDNIAKQLGYSKDLIAEALGHEYGNKVTGIYLEAYDKELIDEMNAKIMERVLKKDGKNKQIKSRE